MNSYEKISGTILLVIVSLTGMIPVFTQANAMNFDPADFKCIAMIGQNISCDEDNSITEETTTTNVDNSTTTNNYDYRTYNVNTTLVDSCNSPGNSSVSIGGPNGANSANQNRELCNGLGAISLPL